MRSIFKTRAFDDDGKKLLLVTLDYEGQMWLVAEWFEPPPKEGLRPKLLVCLSILRHWKLGDGEADFELGDPIPKSVLLGRVPPELRDVYIVQREPEIYLRQF